MDIQNHGTCFLCKEAVNYRSVSKHLKKCVEKNTLNSPSEKEKIFLIKVYSGKSFWIFIEINGSSTLEKLDNFLRKIWLECCGHMSQFTINSESYSCDGEMGKMIRRILNVGDEFDYAYDFGSTTELQGKVISVRAGKLNKSVHLLARNDFPEDIKCTICQQNPEAICSVCYEVFCQACKKEHNNCEGEEFMLPVVNSPRMGVCGYTGQA